MLRNNRLLRKSGSTFTDWTTVLSKIHGTSQVVNLQLGDHFYIGADLPFNHRYFDIKVANDAAAVLSIDIWTGSGWTPVVDILDETQNSSGIHMAQSGIISWSPDKYGNGTWTRYDTRLMTGSDLENGPSIFNLFWARLSYSLALKATMELSYIGHKFSEDSALIAQYPDRGEADMMTAFKAGKTDWKEQHLVAGEYIVQDLRGIKNLLTTPDQILDWRQFENAGIHKCASVIYSGMGDDYADQKKQADIDYKKSLSVGKFNVDLNESADLDDFEKTTNSEYGSR